MGRNGSDYDRMAVGESNLSWNIFDARHCEDFPRWILSWEGVNYGSDFMEFDGWLGSIQNIGAKACSDGLLLYNRDRSISQSLHSAIFNAVYKRLIQMLLGGGHPVVAIFSL